MCRFAAYNELIRRLRTAGRHAESAELACVLMADVGARAAAPHVHGPTADVFEANVKTAEEVAYRLIRQEAVARAGLTTEPGINPS